MLTIWQDVLQQLSGLQSHQMGPFGIIGDYMTVVLLIGYSMQKIQRFSIIDPVQVPNQSTKQFTNLTILLKRKNTLKINTTLLKVQT